MLGLAELSEEQTVDPWLVQQIAPTAREHLIAQALDDGLMKQEQMETLLKWESLEATPRLLLLSDLRRLGNEIDSEMINELSRSTDLSISMFAALLGDNDDTIDNTTQSLRRATRRDRDNALQRTLLLIRQYNFTEANTLACFTAGRWISRA